MGAFLYEAPAVINTVGMDMEPMAPLAGIVLYERRRAQ
jgi:hypothetical protein